MNHRAKDLAILVALIAGFAPGRAESPAATPQTTSETMKIRIICKDKTCTATLVDGPTTRDFVAQLPLTIRMKDLFSREKYGPVPKPISAEGQRSKTYEAGDIGYWSPGNEVAIFYRHDGQEIPAPGIIIIGRIDSGAEVFRVPGTLEVRFERQP
jgi:hypothetical protein